MILIDFIAGSHGNFLEFMCNKFIAKLNLNFLPFNKLGASHIKPYNADKVFFADHYSQLKKPLSNQIVRITYTEDDLLLLSSISLLRAGDFNIDNNLLEFNTYNKLNTIHYSHLLDNINSNYPEYKLSKDNPDCPRFILREFFKFGFKNPEIHGFIAELKALQYPSGYDVIDFPFSSFYNYELFLKDFKKLSSWYNNESVDEGTLKDIWDKFIQKQIYRDHKKQCDEIIHSIIMLECCNIPPLSLFQESYINGVLENRFGIEMPFIQNEYFKSTSEIIEYLCLK
jgi:hypothetical protein